MLTVYEICRDPRFQSLVPCDQYDWEAARLRDWAFDGVPTDDLEMRVTDPQLLKPDVYAIPGGFAFDKSLDEAVFADSIEHSTERLFRPFEDRMLIIPNVTWVLTCLNLKTTVFGNEGVEYVKFEFSSERLNHSLFKAYETRATQILTVEGMSIPMTTSGPV